MAAAPEDDNFIINLFNQWYTWDGGIYYDVGMEMDREMGNYNPIISN